MALSDAPSDAARAGVPAAYRMAHDRVLLHVCHLARQGEHGDAQAAHAATHWLIERFRKDALGAAYEPLPLVPLPDCLATRQAGTNAQVLHKPPRTHDELVAHMRALAQQSAAARRERAAARRAAREAVQHAAWEAAARHTAMQQLREMAHGRHTHDQLAGGVSLLDAFLARCGPV
jgi:hypothetical protein